METKFRGRNGGYQAGRPGGFGPAVRSAHDGDGTETPTEGWAPVATSDGNAERSPVERETGVS